MDISFNGGRFVSSQSAINYNDILDDFDNASIIRIMTYNISAKDNNDALLTRLNAVKETTEIKLITNIPSRFPQYYPSIAGQHMRNKARANIEVYLKKLDPSTFDATFAPYFNFTNHAKIIGTENIVYIGSANYSNESRYNIETGIIITDRSFIAKLYTEFFENIIKTSVPYFDDDFQVLRLLAFSLQIKFNIHKEKILDTLYLYNSEKKKYFFVNAESHFTDDDLNELVADLSAFQSLDIRAENAYTEDDVTYNERIEKIVESYNSIDLNWLIEISSADDLFYNYVNYDLTQRASQIFSNEYSSEGYDEYLDEYLEKAMDDANYEFDILLSEVNDISDKYLDEIEKVICTLDMTCAFIDEFSKKKINSTINNT